MKLFNYVKPQLEAYFQVEQSFKESKLDQRYFELIKIRATQLNGCAFCLNMHTVDAMKNGETAQRIFLLDAWRDSDLFTEKEQIVLELTEAITYIEHFNDDLYERAHQHFTEQEYALLLVAIAQINLWNRLNIGIKQEINKNYK